MRIVGYENPSYEYLCSELDVNEQKLPSALELARQVAEAVGAEAEAQLIVGPPDHSGPNNGPFHSNREALTVVRTRLAHREQMQAILRPVDSRATRKAGMREDASPRKVLLALQRCAVATLDQSAWLEFGHLINEEALSWIRDDPRLLRSLRFGDDDYGERVFSFLQIFVGEDLQHLRTCVEFLRLESWLQITDVTLFEELYGLRGPRPEEADLSSLADASAIRENLARLQRQKGDPPALVGTAKDLIESTAKVVLSDRGRELPDDLAGLIKATQIVLHLHASQVGDGGESILKATKRIRGGLSSIALGVVEMRNAGGTGHGRLTSHGAGDLGDDAQLAATAASLWISNILAVHARLPLVNETP